MKPLLSLLSPAGAGARLNVLIFHRVLPQPDPLFPDEVDAARFDEILGWVKSWFQVLPLDEAARRLADGSLPARAAVLTFDESVLAESDAGQLLLDRESITAWIARCSQDEIVYEVKAFRVQSPCHALLSLSTEFLTALGLSLTSGGGRVHVEFQLDRRQICHQHEVVDAVMDKGLVRRLGI